MRRAEGSTPSLKPLPAIRQVGVIDTFIFPLVLLYPLNNRAKGQIKTFPSHTSRHSLSIANWHPVFVLYLPKNTRVL